MRYRLTEHAVERYALRVKPALSRQVAASELKALVEAAELFDHPPCWKTESEVQSPYYAELAEGICAAVDRNGYVITVLCRGGLSAEARKARNAYNARERRKRRRKSPRAKEGTRPTSRIEGEAWPSWRG